jgi:PAS domain S-box-containing protein
MSDQDKTKQRLLEELAQFRQRVAVLEGVLGANVDITEQKRAEAALKRPNNELEEEVRERTAEFSKANEQLKWEIQERRRAEEALRDNESRLVFALDVSKSGAWDLDLVDHTAQRSPQHDRIFGYESLLPVWTYEMFLEHVVPEDRDAVDRQFRHAVDTRGDWSFECRIRRKGGQIRWIWAAGRPRPDNNGNPQRMTGIVQDITDRKQTEQALKQSERRFRNYFEQGLIGMAVTSVDKRWLEVNDRLCEMLGYRREELVQTNWAALTHPDDVEPNLRFFNALMAGEIEHFTLNKRYVKKDGSIVHATIYTRAFRKDDGTIDHIVTLIDDITARKQAEEALRRSQATLEAFFSASTAILNIVDDDFRYIKTDGLTPTYFGLDSQSIVGKSVRELAPEFVREYGPMLRQIIETGEPVHNVEVKGRAPSRPGEMVYWRASYFPVPLPDGRRGRGTVAVEITDMKRAEEALRQSEAKYRMLVETSPDTVVLADLRGNFTFVSHGILELHGSEDLGEFIGRHPVDFIVQEDHQRFLANFRRTVEEGVTRNIEYTFIRKDGTQFPGEVSAVVIRDSAGKPESLMALVKDVTERKRTTEALRASEERYELAVRGAGVGIWDYDVRTGKVYYSPRWKMLFGFDENEIGDSLEDWAKLLHPDERDWVLKFQEDFLAGTSPTVTVEYRLRHKDGSYRWIVAHGLAVRDEQGKACRLVGSHGDITDRKRAEEALEREHRTLKHLLQSSDHERQVIAYEIHDGVAQELAAAIMQFDAFDYLKETKPKQAADAYHAGMVLLRQGHVEVRRLISGVRPPILDEEGIVAAVGHLVNEERCKEGPKIEYLSDVEFERLNQLLENAIYRIVQEALTNACRYSKSKKVQVELVQHGDWIRIEVRDYGAGFNPDEIKENQFGLAGIRERARLLGGTATVESGPGKGTRIAVELPVIVAVSPTRSP